MTGRGKLRAGGDERARRERKKIRSCIGLIWKRECALPQRVLDVTEQLRRAGGRSMDLPPKIGLEMGQGL